MKKVFVATTLLVFSGLVFIHHSASSAQMFDCGSSDIFSVTLPDEEAVEADVAMICMGEHLNDGCSPAMASLETKAAGTIIYAIEGGSSDACSISIEYGPESQIPLEEYKAYADTKGSCFASLDELTEGNPDVDPATVPGSFGAAVYLFTAIDLGLGGPDCTTAPAMGTEVTTITDINGDERQAAFTYSASSFLCVEENMCQNLSGKMILRPEANGEAYYVHHETNRIYSLGRPDDAFKVMREQGIGIASADLDTIQPSTDAADGPDADGDGLADLMEEALGTDPNNTDTDSDGFDDFEEIDTSHNPFGPGIWSHNDAFATKHAGKIFLDVQRNGEAWYINPKDNLRYYLGRPADAFSVMRQQSLGISEANFLKIRGKES